MDFSKFDVPMLRDLYRQLRSNTIRMAGGNEKHFDEAVRLELEHKDMNPTPQNYVVCAMEIEREEMLRDMEGAEHEAELAFIKDRDAWEAAMEDKYDFIKEGC